MFKVIGLGSPFGDDRIGLVLIDALRRSSPLAARIGHDLVLIAADRPGPALLGYLEGVDRAVLIDAVVSGAPPGHLHRWHDSAVPADAQRCVSSHGLGLAQTLALGHQLGALPAQLLVLGIEIEQPHNSPDLSQLLRAQLPALTARIADEIKAFLA